MSVADRLVLLNDAEIEQIGTAKDLYETPNSRFVAEFIGDINTIESEVVETGASVVVAAGDHEFTFGADEIDLPDHGLAVGQRLDLCIRPHGFDLVDPRAGDGGSDANRRLRGEVETRIYQGQFITYHVTTDLGRVTVTTDVERFDIGDEVDAVWSVDETYVFPAEGA